MENRDGAIAGRRMLLEALGGEPIVPESMLGSMASVGLHSGSLASDADARALRDALAVEDGIEVPISAFPVPAARPDPSTPVSTFFVRISWQRYVETGDIERLIDALARRGIGKRARNGASSGAAPA